MVSGLWKLRLSMIGTLALIIGVSTLFITLILRLIGAFNFTSLIVLVTIFNSAQWLFAPYIIDAIYRVRELRYHENPELHQIIDRLSKKSGIKKPKLMIANVSLPNAFAYGSPLTGNRVAVTKGLLQILDIDEIEAVLGHEIGHLKHRDVQAMMFLSLLPSIFYLIAEWFYYSSLFRGYGYEERDQGGAMMFLIAMLSLVAYYILTLLILGFSRLREYYADRHSATITEYGAEKLASALVKIAGYSKRIKSSGVTAGSTSFKALFICDPDAKIDLRTIRLSTEEMRLIREIAHRKLTLAERLAELFSTHPNLTKRLRALMELM